MTAPANTAPNNAAPNNAAVGPHPGDEPLGNPASRWFAVLISLLLLALAGVAARDLWYHFYGDEAPSDSWLGRTWDFLGSFEADVTAVVVGILLVLVGLFLVFFTFKPRPHGHVRVNSPASIWTRPVDIARKTTFTTRGDLGGEQVSTKANRKSVKVQVVDDGSGTAMQERITRALNDEFRVLKAQPAVSVKLLPNPGSQQVAAQRANVPQQPSGSTIDSTTPEVTR
ncbi:hypothetical protein HMPREF3151_07960 [Corynebacterium sp. HMSC05H05]|uniref:hypothetical protein n=1 Tax=Corynebacterium sp. HMSC05H05 TaxID=1581119 RepID=UPI0008A42303|nr:hypothetical protein [Corynebacterium sp. HMSC05H05]OFT57326.1 hypothetical protein HMPREF3151_07960 [Corynebacterium sp. HMSC05H05]